MKEYKNIDRLYQEKFRDFEVEPSGKVWENIDRNINRKNKKDKPVFWWWFSGIAAGLALLLYLNSNTVDNTPVETIDSNTTEVKTQTDKQIFDKHSKPEEQTSNFVTHKGNDKTKNVETIPLTPKHPKKIIQKQTSVKQSLITQSPVKSKGFNTPVATLKKEVLSTTKKQQVVTTTQDNKKAISTKEETTIKKKVLKVIKEQALAEESNSKIIEKQTNKDKWSIATFAAPVYLNSFDKNTSSIDAQFNNNTKQGSFSSAYGVQVAYQINNKFSLQSGVHIVDYGYKTYDVYVSPSGAVNHYANITYNENANLINIYSLPSVQYSQDETDRQDTKGNIMQVFGYVEIPLEVKYQINKQNGFGINVVGGFSTLLLNKNQIFIETDGLSSNLGEASNLNSLNFSGNVGLEFNYKLFKNFNFNMTPMFKVQTQTFKKNTGGFSPYAIGVYSGLNYRF